MSAIKFDKVLLTNLEKSLSKEVLRTNRYGSYTATTVIDCNTRKYHGLLVTPVPGIDRDRHVLLSSCDETIIQHGAEFNLGIHKYQYDYFSPRGHKYIREFHLNGTTTTTIYRIGGVILKKQRTLVQDENRVLISYELLEAHSPTTLRLRPFLAFRSVNQLMVENYTLNKTVTEHENGISLSLYEGYPDLVMQTNRKSTFVPDSNWYRGIEYYKEQERGYDFKEDLYVPGYFEMPIKKGEVIVFSAGTTPIAANQIKRLFDSEQSTFEGEPKMYDVLRHAASQFYISTDEKENYLMAGYPWFAARARDTFIALPGTTLAIGDVERFEKIMCAGTRAVNDFMNARPKTTQIRNVSAPDVLLWYIWAVQKYAEATSLEHADELYGEVVQNIINFIRKQQHPNLFLHENNLLYTNGKEQPATWMNAIENGRPITPRNGYVVEINALWYNALRFAAELSTIEGNENRADLLNYQAGSAAQSFVNIFWNGAYLYDFVDQEQSNPEVRPSMIFAVSLPYSPLDKKQQKSVVDIITRELLTIKGLRTISPKSGMYRPNYIGGMQERNRNYHNGPVWPWTTAAFAEAYLKLYKRSAVSFLLRMLAGFESELTELTIGTLSELYDGNPPFRGHGAMSFAVTIAEVLRTLQLVEKAQKKMESEEAAL